MLDGESPPLNSLKGIISLMKRIIPPPLEFLSNHNGFAKPEIRNHSKGNISAIFVSDNKRTSISFIIKKFNISNMFLVELIFSSPIMIQFGFSSLRFRKVLVALLLLLFSQLFSFGSSKEKGGFSGWLSQSHVS